MEELQIDDPQTGVRRTDTDYQEQFHAIAADSLEVVIAHLKAETDTRLQHPLYIRGYSEKGSSHEIPVDPARYQSAQFALATDPQSEEGTVYKRVDYGYSIFGDFRRIGFLNFVRMDSSDEAVLEVGFGSELARDYFHHHLFGRTFSPEQRERMRAVQEAVFAHVKKNPTAQEKLREFSRSRAWPTGLEEIAVLAYFDNRITPLEELADREGISSEDMYVTGWYDLSFTQSGQVTYSVRDFQVIRIPYFTTDKRIEVWRTRNLRPSRATSHKYTSWPLDRSVERTFCVEEKLYYGWDLEKAMGHTLVITEGEFKCLVATQLSGILTVGIPGITEVDDTLVDALVQANASEYIVVLDRDPRGKGFMRVDGITDSERAAYGIALALQRAGAHNVRVGRIPNVRNGQKVGIDDLILDQGVEAYLRVITDSVEPQHYAQAIGLNETFYLLLHSRQRIKKALEHYDHSVRRGGRHVDEDVYQEALWLHDKIETLYASFLIERFRGAFRIDQPSRENIVLFRTSSIDGAERKIAMTQHGEGIALEHFQSDIIFFQFFPADIPRESLHVGRNDLTVPFSMEALLQFFQTGESESPDLPLFLQQGLDVLGMTPEEGRVASWMSIHDLGIILLAGYLSQDFPTDEFTFVPELAFFVDRKTHWDEHIRIPLAIFKKSSGEAVAFAILTLWEDSEALPNALMLDNRRLLFATSFLRQRSTIHDETKFRMVTETLYPYWFERKKQETVETMTQLGVSAETVERNQLLALSLADYEELIEHFAFRRLLNQATNSGLFRWDESAKIVPRFRGDTLLLPVFDEKKEMVSLRILPLTLEDHVPPYSDPSEKLIRQIDGGDRHLLRNLAPERQLYLQERLHRAQGKQLLVTLHELDGLLLASQEQHVVSLNHALELHPDILGKICSAAPDSLCFIIAGQIPPSKYDAFNFDTIQGFVKDLYDIQEALQTSRAEGTAPISCSFTVLPFPLTHLTTQQDLSEREVSAIVASAVPLQAYLQEHKFNSAMHRIVQCFLSVNARFLDYLEVQALPDILDARPIEWWVKENKRLYAAIQVFAEQAHRVTLPGVEVYFQRKLHLHDPLPVEELLRIRREEEKMLLHKPLYTRNRSFQGSLSDDFSQLFHRVLLERTQVSGQDIRNSFSLRTAPISHQKEPVNSEQTSLVEASSGVTPRQNAKGILLAFHQKSPQRYSRLRVVQDSKIGEAFTITLQVSDSERHLDLVGTGTGLRKRDAEAVACEHILQQIEEVNVPCDDTTMESVAVENPKGRVYEILQKAHRSFQEPSITTVQHEGEFQVSVTLSYQEKTYTGKGKGMLKKEAEKEAFRLILEKMEGQRNSRGLTPGEAREIGQALQMDAGDKNYIGHLYTVAQRLQIRPPQFITTFHLVEEGTAYHTHVSFQLKDDFSLEGEADSLFQDIGKQQAALSVLSTLSEILSQSEEGD